MTDSPSALLATDHIFLSVSGNVYDNTFFNETFFADYLNVFESLEVVCRMRNVHSVPAKAWDCSIRGLHFRGIPALRGARWILCGARRASRLLSPALTRRVCVIARVPSEIGFAAGNLAIARKLPLMLEVIGDPWESFRGISPLPQYLAGAIFETHRLKRLLQYADIVTYVSREHLQRRYPAAPTCSTESISSIRLDPAHIAGPRTYDRPPRPVKIALVAGLVSVKRHCDLLQALARCDAAGFPTRLECIGDGPLRSKLECLAHDLGLDEKVRFLGQIADPARIRAHLDSADIFVMCSSTEGLPRAALEAMSRGLPVIATRTGGLTEIVPAENLVPVRDVRALAGKIMEVADDPVRLTRLSQASVEISRSYSSAVLSPRRRGAYRKLRDLFDDRFEGQRRLVPYGGTCVVRHGVLPQLSATSEECVQARTQELRVLHVAALAESAALLLRPLAVHQLARGYSVEIACAPGTTKSVLTDNGLVVHDVPFSRRVLSLSHVWALIRLVRLMRQRKYRVLHAHTLLASLISRLAAALSGVPIVIYHHRGSLWDLTSPGVRFAYTLAEWLVGRVTTFVLTINCTDRDEVVRRRIMPPERVLCLHCGGSGIDMYRFSPQSVSPEQHQRTRVELGLRDGDFVFGYVGRLVRAKGIFELLESFRVLSRTVPQARLLMVGPKLASERDQRAHAEMNRFIAAHELESKVLFGGFRTDMPAVFRVMDVLILPSHREGFGMALAESMAMGVPVIATATRGARELVRDNETGLLVRIGDIDALTRAMLHMFTDPHLRERLRTAASQCIMKDRSVSAVCAKVDQVYDALLREAAPEPEYACR